MAVTKRSVYIKLKQLLSSLTGIIWQDIRADNSLSDLGFNDDGKRALAAEINKVFNDVEVHLTPDDTASAGSVRALVNKIWEQIPDHYKKQEEEE
ncbi:MAG: hypothetical protein JSV88_09025 [Candidatus Aminicenantes bacterium]|nr:MAG: hypothetical protein JSV88_09025 [Candidatus Aminicenantes bacterium]